MSICTSPGDQFLPVQTGIAPQKLVTLLLLKIDLKIDLTTAPNFREKDMLLKATKQIIE